MSYSDFIVSPKELFEKKDDPDLVIVDCPWEQGAYLRAHIPHAVCRPGHPYIKAMDSDGSQSALLMGPPEFKELAGQMGIQRGSEVVVYDEWGTIFATRLWWMLRYYGHENIRVLDGGWQGWVSAGYPVSFEANRPENPETDFVPTPNSERLITLDELKDRCQEQDLQVFDVRSEDEYTGKDAHGNNRAGHIPGAVHLEWNRFLNNSTNPEAVRDFRPVDELKTLVDEAGLTRDCTVVAYCQAAVRGAMGVFVLEMLGHPRALLYDGSMAEWANLDDTPLE